MKRFITAFLMCLSIWSAQAQTEVSADTTGYAAPDRTVALVDDNRRSEIVGNITDDYTEWQTVAINGKLRMDGLPLSPSLRIFMRRGESVSISLRAPFVGEVARIEANNDSLTAINKMGRTYCSVAVDATALPVGIGQLQALLLGRVALAGVGELNLANLDNVEIYEDEDYGTVLCPTGSAVIDGCTYGFTATPEGQLMQAVASVAQPSDVLVVASYSYPGTNGKKDIDVDAAVGEHSYQAQLELNAPDWEAKGFEPFEPTAKYRKLPLRDFLKSF